MKSINGFVADVVSTYGNAPSTGENPNPFGSASTGKGGFGVKIGACPRCGGSVAETPKAFSCEYTRSKKCGFALWKDNKWFASQGKKITKAIATALVNDGRVTIPDLKSQKSGKKYGATVILDDDKDGYASFKLEFLKK